MKTLVSGASGLVGYAVVECFLRQGFPVIAHHFENTPSAPDPKQPWVSLDLTSPSSLQGLLEQVRPDLVVNCAAISEPSRVEARPSVAEKINSRLPILLGSAAARGAFRLIHLSTDMVFSGQSERPFRHDDPVEPYGAYGLLKRKAEEGLLGLHSENIAIIRVTLVNGNSPGGRRSIHEKLIQGIRQGAVPGLFTDEFRQPVSARSIAEVCFALAHQKEFAGLYHWAGADTLSRYEIGSRLLEHFRLPSDRIRPALRPDQKPPRPRHLALDTSVLPKKLGLSPPEFQEQLADLILPP
jgi:dTDP-4-dehydrorhamnose reductase